MIVTVTAARDIRGRTGGDLLVSPGAEGALLLTRAGDWQAVPPDITPVNPTGAGDALLAGYLAAEAVAPPTPAGVRGLGRQLGLPGRVHRGPARPAGRPGSRPHHPLNCEYAGQGGRP